MHNIFDIKRFGKWLVSDLKSCTASYGISFIVISLMGLIIYAGTAIMGEIIKGTWSGPGIGFRFTVFITCLAVLLITQPSRCYGHITDKRSGSTWLLVPVSHFEKFLSMTIVSAIIIPAAYITLYLGIDAILCSIDSTCGESLVAFATAIPAKMTDVPDEVVNAISPMVNPFLYIDDIIGTSLLFLLGAVFFKKNKIVMTILCTMAISLVAGSITAPLILNGFMEDPEGFMSAFTQSGSLAISDTINDMSIVIFALTATFFRIKTLKH